MADEITLAGLLEDSVEDLYENAPCGYLSTLPDGRIVKANATFLRWLGHPPDAVVGVMRFADLLTAGGRIYHETHYAPMLAMHGSVREIALDLVRADGGLLPTLVSSVVKRDEHGAPAVVRTTVFEATHRRAYEQELLRAKRSAEEAGARARLLAETLQRSLIPPALPEIAGLEVAGVYRPAGVGDEVGGDFYDVFGIGAADWAFVVGDVCGKGAEAAAVTALARYTVRAAAMRERRPGRVLGELNMALLRDQSDRFCTAVYARLRDARGRWRVTVASGGHPLPLRITPDGEVTELGRDGDLLGVMPSPSFVETKDELRPGEALVMFTDGVPEARGREGFYGERRLRELLGSLAGAGAATVADTVAQEVVGFQDDAPRDDIAIVVVRVPPETR